MRYMGIDFGSKRIGIALSDRENHFALPYRVLPNDKNMLNTVFALVETELITDIVIGESKDYSGSENEIMEKARKFSGELVKAKIAHIHWEPEFMTSVEAERLQGKSEKLDASAAAIILKSFLERQSRLGQPRDNVI